MNTCRSWLKAVIHTAVSREILKKFRNAAVLGDQHDGFTVELADATQIYVGRTHCRYCARAEALSTLKTSAESSTHA